MITVSDLVYFVGQFQHYALKLRSVCGIKALYRVTEIWMANGPKGRKVLVGHWRPTRWLKRDPDQKGCQRSKREKCDLARIRLSPFNGNSREFCPFLRNSTPLRHSFQSPLHLFAAILPPQKTYRASWLNQDFKARSYRTSRILLKAF